MYKNVSALICFTLILFIGQGFSQVTKGKAIDSAKVFFPLTECDFGILSQGGDGSCVFVFENTGNIPLIIRKVKASCGCTSPFWPERPILPGETEEVTVVYDTQRLGEFNKTITFLSNAKSVVLKVKGEVIKKDD